MTLFGQDCHETLSNESLSIIFKLQCVIFQILQQTFFSIRLQIKYLVNFGYLPSPDLKTGKVQTEDQVRDAIRTMQVVQHKRQSTFSHKYTFFFGIDHFYHFFKLWPSSVNTTFLVRRFSFLEAHYQKFVCEFSFFLNTFQVKGLFLYRFYRLLPAYQFRELSTKPLVN